MSILQRLNTRISSYGPGSGGGGRSSADALTTQDIAAAVGMLRTQIGAELLLFKENGDMTAGGALLFAWRAHVSEHARVNGWRCKNVERWKWLADGTLEEYVAEKSVCPCCDGAGIIANAKVRAGTGKFRTTKDGKREEVYVYVYRNIECERCEGSSVVVPRTVDRSRQLQVDQKTFKETWRPRWDDLLHQLAVIEGTARWELRQALR